MLQLSKDEALETERWLETIGKTLSESDFQAFNTAFLNEHNAKFADGDENSLETTKIHEQYQELVRAGLQSLQGRNPAERTPRPRHLPAPAVTRGLAPARNRLLAPRTRPAGGGAD